MFQITSVTNVSEISSCSCGLISETVRNCVVGRYQRRTASVRCFSSPERLSMLQGVVSAELVSVIKVCF